MANTPTTPPEIIALHKQYDNTEGPVYGLILPLLRYAVADQVDWVSNNPDDLDAAELGAVLQGFVHTLDAQDTTVRETY